MIQLLALSAAISVQQLSCFPLDTLSTDRAVFSFNLPEQSGRTPEKGTLFLSSGIEDDGHQDSTGVLPLQFETATPEENVVYRTENETSEFRVQLSPTIFGKFLKDVSVLLTLKNKNDNFSAEVPLTCYTTVVQPGV